MSTSSSICLSRIMPSTHHVPPVAPATIAGRPEGTGSMARLRILFLVLALAALATPARSTIQAAAPEQTGSTAPRYDLVINVDTKASHVNGSMVLDYTNRTGTALGDIVLR